MVQSSVIGFFILGCLLINCTLGLEKNKTENDDQKTVKKRGIFHLGVHPNFHHVPHVHLPRFPVITKIPIAPTVIAKPILPPPIPVTPSLFPASVTPYHITPGDAVVTSFSATYPRFPIFSKTIVPAVLPPHHHHHHFDPHFHVAATKPIIPVAVPFPGIRQPKIPIYINPNPIKPVLFNPIKPHFHPIAPTPTFVPIPIPSNPPMLPGISSINNNNQLSTTQETQHSEQQQISASIGSGSWQPIFMLTKPSQQQVSFIDKKHSAPFNYHATLSQKIPSNNLISGQGTVSNQLAQQLALYQNHHQQLLNEHQDSFPYSPATYQAEKFTQSYDLPSNDGSFNGLSSYQVPLHQ
ncbi:hypothetical protein PVAND_003803 [Polypedilum vanderplanki]|uniref:Uncharacterized protein n=1 Tax=Polypedilum vanderplanki TaxID=319348 RepID=A0A9J6BV52_POLVA|nr:hypothetical protein PVAND_003803 [Polypedilum vanderplanki]